jgi:hypothetical protein
MAEARTPSIGPIDKEALRRKYAEERDKRLRPDGNDQYIEIKDQLGHYLEDPYVPVQERDPVTDHVTFAFIGGGFSGLVTGCAPEGGGHRRRAHPREGRRLRRHLVLEPLPRRPVRHRGAHLHAPARGDGAHAHREVRARPEILEHCQRIGRHYDLYGNALFHTQVDEPDLGRGRAALAHPHQPRRRVHGAVRRHPFTGPLHVPKLPGIPGIEDFEGPQLPHQPLGLRLHRR